MELKKLIENCLKSKQSTLKVQFYLQLCEWISSNIVKLCNIQVEHSWTFNFIIIEAIIWLIFLVADVKIV